MSEKIETKNPILRGIFYTVLVISYSYYISIGGQFLNKYMPYYNLGFILVGLSPFVIGLFIHITGIYQVNFRLTKKPLSASSYHDSREEVNFNNLDDPYGIIIPISEYKEKLEEILKSISDKHFTISDEVLVSLYTHGLSRVNERFWTTTYLTSGFWTHGRTDVISANKLLLNRLFNNENKSVRRIFLLKNTIEEEMKYICNNVSELKNQGLKGEIRIKEMFEEFEYLKSNCETFMSKGCEIKYYYDSTDHTSIGIIKNKTEIAIYDNFRLDYFDGGDDAEITGVKIFHEKHRLFDTRREEIITYFSSLWKRSEDISKLFDKLENALKYYSEKIDYSYPRLLRFDYDLNEKDKNLKIEELMIVTEYLKTINHFQSVNEYLDIGTCTGRYPFNLSNNLLNATILGVDADDDCIEFCKIQKLKLSNSIVTNNILFDKMDFLYEPILNRRFELITCMLGTISHFGWNKNEKFEDDLQKALKKISSLLTNDGILIISNWTPFALSGNILDIYNDYDRKRLRNFTEDIVILKNRLEKYFVIIDTKRTHEKNLDIIFCKKKIIGNGNF